MTPENETNTAEPEPVSTASLEPKLRAADQTVCDEPAEKGEPCFGHLKRYETAPAALRASLGPGEHLFRCHRCHRVYRGAPMKFLR